MKMVGKINTLYSSFDHKSPNYIFNLFSSNKIQQKSKEHILFLAVVEKNKSILIKFTSERVE